MAAAEMAEYLQRVREQPSELLVGEWNSLSVIYKNAVDSRRAARRVITSIEQNEKPEGKEQLASHAREYIAEVEGELQKIREGVLALTDKKLIPSASTDESKVLYCKMKSDYYRYLAQCATGDAKGKAAEGACVAHAEATKTSERDLVAIHPVRLGMALNTPVVAQRQISIDRTVQKTTETPQLQRIDRAIDGLVVQIENVPQAHVAEKTVEIPQSDVVKKIVETAGIQQWNVEHIADTPVLPVEEELAEISKVFSQNRVQQHFGGQTVETPAISLAEEIIEIPVTRTQDKTQHVVVVNTHVQHTVNAVEAEKPIINETINQMTKHVEIPQLQIVEKTIETAKHIQQEETVEVIQPIPQDRMSDHVVQQTVKELRSKFEVGHMSKVHAQNRSDKNRWREKRRFEAKQYPQDTQERADLTNQRQVLAIRTVQKTVEVPKVQYIDKVADIPVDVQRQGPTNQALQHDIDEVGHIPCPRRVLLQPHCR